MLGNDPKFGNQLRPVLLQAFVCLLRYDPTMFLNDLTYEALL